MRMITDIENSNTENSNSEITNFGLVLSFSQINIRY